MKGEELVGVNSVVHKRFLPERRAVDAVVDLNEAPVLETFTYIEGEYHFDGREWWWHAQ